ncbi:MAG: TolC family protein, partial [Muribaculaceae bacterium]|nr:TolC family protein [Muribaculaceae bacterium]
SYKVIEENRDMASFTASLYQRQYEVGTASQYDVLRTQVALRNIEPQLTQAEITVRQARLQLLLLMGIGDYFEITPDVTLASFEQTMYDRAMALPRDIDGNSDLRLLDLRTEMLSRSLAVQRMSWFPTLALTAGYNWTSSSDGSPFRNFRWNPYSMIGLSLSVPLFEGGQRYSRVRQARIQVDEMKWQRDNLVNSINMQVDIAFENIRLNVKQIESCSESVNQATMAHDIVKKSFEIGAASYLDLRDAELALTQSKLAYNQAIYNFLVASGNLELLVGGYDVSGYMPAR